MTETTRARVFDELIGRLDRILSEMVAEGRKFYGTGPLTLDEFDRQTLKHHAEDMILAGRKILKDIGFGDEL